MSPFLHKCQRPSHDSKHSIEDDGFTITSCVIVVMKTSWGFVPQFGFGLHEVRLGRMNVAASCCSRLPSDSSSSIFLSLQLSLPPEIFSAGSWKRKPCDHGGACGVLFLLFCKPDNKHPPSLDFSLTKQTHTHTHGHSTFFHDYIRNYP